MIPALSPERRRQLAKQQRRESSASQDTGNWPTMLLPSATIGGSTAVSQAISARLISAAVPAVAVPVPATEEPSVAGKVVAGSLVQGIGKVLTYVSALLTMVLVTRMLTVSDYAAYGLAMTLVALVQVVAQADTTQIGIREVARYPKYADDIISAVISLRVVTSVVIYGLLAVVVQFLPYTAHERLATTVISLSFIFFSLGMALDVVFLPRLKMLAPSLADFFAEIVQVAALGGLLFYSFQTPLDSKAIFYGVLAITSLGNLVILVVRWVGAARQVHLRLRLDTYHWKYLLSISIPLAAVSIFGQIQYRADAVIISLINPGPAGHNIAVYSLAVKIMDVVLTVPVILIGIAFPPLARYAHIDVKRFQRALQRVFNGSIALAMPATIMLVLLAPGIVQIIGSGKYPAAALPLQILAISALFNYLATLYASLVTIYNRQSQLIWAYGVNIAINVGLNLLLIPQYSYVGSAAITVLTEIVRLASVIFVASRAMKFRPNLWIVLQALVASGLMAAVILGLNAMQVIHSQMLFTLIGGGIAAVVYALGLFAVGGVDKALVAKVPFLRR